MVAVTAVAARAGPAGIVIPEGAVVRRRTANVASRGMNGAVIAMIATASPLAIISGFALTCQDIKK